MDLCKLDKFENISEMRKKAIITPDGKKIGHIIDVVFDERYYLHSFIIGGSFWEEFREKLGIIDDIDPVLPAENIIEISKKAITIDLNKDQLKHKFQSEAFPEQAYFYNNLKRKEIHDYYNNSIGKICNLIFLPCGEAAFLLKCSLPKESIPRGITSEWDLLLPSANIESISHQKIKLSVNVEMLEKTLNHHLLDGEAARAYLNSLEEKNTAEMRAMMRTNPTIFIR